MKTRAEVDYAVMASDPPQGHRLHRLLPHPEGGVRAVYLDKKGREVGTERIDRMHVTEDPEGRKHLIALDAGGKAHGMEVGEDDEPALQCAQMNHEIQKSLDLFRKGLPTILKARTQPRDFERPKKITEHKYEEERHPDDPKVSVRYHGQEFGMDGTKHHVYTFHHQNDQGEDEEVGYMRWKHDHTFHPETGKKVPAAYVDMAKMKGEDGRYGFTGDRVRSPHGHKMRKFMHAMWRHNYVKFPQKKVPERIIASRFSGAWAGEEKEGTFTDHPISQGMRNRIMGKAVDRLLLEVRKSMRDPGKRRVVNNIAAQMDTLRDKVKDEASADTYQSHVAALTREVGLGSKKRKQAMNKAVALDIALDHINARLEKAISSMKDVSCTPPGSSKHTTTGKEEPKRVEKTSPGTDASGKKRNASMKDSYSGKGRKTENTSTGEEEPKTRRPKGVSAKPVGAAGR